MTFGHSYYTNRDLSFNGISSVEEGALDGVSDALMNLNLANNHIECLSAGAVSDLKALLILNLSGNRLTRIPNTQDGLKIFFGGNPLRCDCALAGNAVDMDSLEGAVCRQPARLEGIQARELTDVDFEDCGRFESVADNDCNSGLRNSHVLRRSHGCPKQCKCTDGIVDCRNRKLLEAPAGYPPDTTEIRLEQNSLTALPPRAFAGYKRLKRIDISNNGITVLPSDAFDGLSSLTSLVFYGNKIHSLSQNVFRGLTSLQLLLLNSNKIKCVHPNAFRDLKSLNLLSLYDNRIQYLENGTFNGLTSLHTLHLARNPFYCHCRLSWMSWWLQKNPVETSGVRCEGPKRLHKRKIATLRDEQYDCEQELNLVVDVCYAATENCPKGCECRGKTVDCSNQMLSKIPHDLPKETEELLLNDNDIQRVPALGLFNRLPRLRRLDFSRNKIDAIEDGAFEGANSIVKLQMGQNRLRDVNNKLFRGLNNLEELDLYSNQIGCITPGAFDSLHYLKTLNLMANPFVCNCHMGWFADWLRNKGFHSNAPRCMEPRHLKDKAISSLALHDFRCTGRNPILKQMCEHI